MNDFRALVESLGKLTGSTVPKPTGTLAGHAAGLPFEVLVHEKLSQAFSNRAWRHYEFLNHVLSANESKDLQGRLEAFGPESLQGLLCRGRKQMQDWSRENLFEEKQNDTAETVVSSESSFDPLRSTVLLVDVKTHNSAKQGQPPNIMSAGKLSEALASGLDEGSIRFDVVYVGVSWVIQDETLKASQVSVVSLFKMKPQVYINWAAAEQIQFHPHLAEQDYKGTREDWAREYLSHFVSSLEKRIKTQEQRLERFTKIAQA